MIEFSRTDLHIITKALVSYSRRKRRDLAHRRRGFGDNPTEEQLDNLNDRYLRIDACEELKYRILKYLNENKGE